MAICFKTNLRTSCREVPAWCICLATALVHPASPFPPPPFWCIFNIPIIAEQPEMSHLGTSLFPLHLCLLFKEANSPSSSSSASLLCWIPPAMLISPASQQLPQYPPSASKGCRLILRPISMLPSLLIATHEGLPFGDPPGYLPCQVFAPSD